MSSGLPLARSSFLESKTVGGRPTGTLNKGPGGKGPGGGGLGLQELEECPRRRGVKPTPHPTPPRRVVKASDLQTRQETQGQARLGKP